MQGEGPEGLWAEAHSGEPRWSAVAPSSLGIASHRYRRPGPRGRVAGGLPIPLWAILVCGGLPESPPSRSA